MHKAVHIDFEEAVLMNGGSSVQSKESVRKSRCQRNIAVRGDEGKLWARKCILLSGSMTRC